MGNFLVLHKQDNGDLQVSGISHNKDDERAAAREHYSGAPGRVVVVPWDDRQEFDLEGSVRTTAVELED